MTLTMMQTKARGEIGTDVDVNLSRNASVLSITQWSDYAERERENRLCRWSFVAMNSYPRCIWRRSSPPITHFLFEASRGDFNETYYTDVDNGRMNATSVAFLIQSDILCYL